MDTFLKPFPQDEGHSPSHQEILEIFKKFADEFTSLNRLAATICNVPISTVHILDKDFQYLVSNVGDVNYDTVPREESICNLTMRKEKEIVIINDLARDERTRKLYKDSDYTFYAGVPLTDHAGKTYGTFCIMDHKPRELGAEEQRALQDLAAEIEMRIDLICQKHTLKSQNESLNQAAAFLENSTDILWVVNPNGLIIEKSAGAKSILGIPNEELVGTQLVDHIKNVDLKKLISEWLLDKDQEPKMNIPVKARNNCEKDIWLNLIFSHSNNMVLATGKDITKEHHAEKRLKDSLAEKQVLLGEIHHRVKNNLAVISSLIYLERRKSDNATIKEILRNSENRINTIAEIHESLYQHNNFKNIDVRMYINNLIASIKKSYALDKKEIQIETRVQSFKMNVNQCLPMALILNELITNAIKHAFDEGAPGRITVSLKKDRRGTITCAVQDNGKGIKKEEYTTKNPSLGITLINTLKKQLEAELSYTVNNGTTCTLTFAADKRKGSVTNLNDATSAQEE